MGFHEVFIQPAGPGALLRDAREMREMTVEDVAKSLKVPVERIQAMEDNRFDVFDAPVYARGFIRRYAAIVDTDPEPLLAAYAALSSIPDEPSLLPPVPKTSSRMRRRRFDWRVPVGMTVLAVLLVGSYVALRQVPLSASVAVPPPPTLAGGPDPAATSLDSTAVPPAGTGVVSALPPQPDNTPARAAAAIPTASDSSVDRPPPLAEAAIAPPRAAGDAIILSGVRETWVQVKDGSGSTAYNDWVRSGETHTVRAAGPWRIFLGHADGVIVRLGAHVVEPPPQDHMDGEVRYGLKPDGTVVK